ncbi:hypothetical protein UUU_30870 [Klebsiella pneumoniae subsp. pneumoniae DSM 30104 = JCM 1662 = NBRC 14940]|nr:hypothetical protein UUU_30870 [Klebsiella pneumoniae subsp. pneumoniae DSM 30104 = JCM 1662 = NBRC 14940]
MPVRHNRIASTHAKMGRSIKKFAIRIKTSYAHFLVIAQPVPL